jgi:DNA polymerase-3 subunit gamma/tau
VAAAPALPTPRSFDEVVALFADKREPVLRHHLMTHVHLVQFAPGRIEVRPTDEAPRDLANKVGGLLSTWTGQRWLVTVVGSGGEQTLRAKAENAAEELRRRILDHPDIKACLSAFPGATVTNIKPILPPDAGSATAEGTAAATGTPGDASDDEAGDGEIADA